MGLEAVTAGQDASGARGSAVSRSTSMGIGIHPRSIAIRPQARFGMVITNGHRNRALTDGAAELLARRAEAGRARLRGLRPRCAISWPQWASKCETLRTAM